MNSLRTSIVALGAAAALVVAASVVGVGSVAAQGAPHEGPGGFAEPDELGAYSIGHTTVQVTDPSRDLDGSTPPTTEGRYLHLDIWYPTEVPTTDHITYTWNNPLYNENPGGTVYPGLPDLAPLTSAGATSLNPVLEGAPLAPGGFPLLIGSHGNLVGSAKNMPDTMETLASHGYVVMSVSHTGNDDAWYQADWLGRRLGLDIGPNPSISAEGTILQRTKDVSFVIDAALDGTVDDGTGIDFSGQVDDERIGVLGFSLGGMTSLATVTGIGSAGSVADPRVKAALMGGGSNYGLLLDEQDYANAEVPLMFLGNDTGIAYDAFDEFTGTREKYLVDIADFNHHIGGYQSSWCQDYENSMKVVDPAVFPGIFLGAAPAFDPSDVANYIFDATFYFVYTGPRQSGVYDYCEPSVFDDISDAQLQAVLFGDPTILDVRDELIGSMPLKPEASIAEITRVTNLYAVSFFNATLRGERSYSRYLNESTANQRSNPLVRFVRDCQKVPDQPIDLRPGDRITFSPVGDTGYDVSVTSGATFRDQGTDALPIVADGVAELALDGFSFPVPGMAEPVDTLIVNENGVISTRTAPDIGGIDDNGSPWYMKGHMLLSAQFTIGTLMKDLDATGPGQVFGYVDPLGERVVVTYRDVPAAGTDAPNSLQVAIEADGTIEMTVGELAATGAAYSPGILGTLGIAGGHTPIADLATTAPTDFSELRERGSVFVPFGQQAAIFEQFVAGTERSCRR
jgi:dienelactone hydrolase